MASEFTVLSSKAAGYDDIRAIFLNTVSAQIMHSASLKLKESYAAVIPKEEAYVQAGRYVSDFLMKNGMEHTLYTAKLESGSNVAKTGNPTNLQQAFKFNPTLDFFVQLVGSTRPDTARKIMPKEFKEYQNSLSEQDSINEARDMAKKGHHHHKHMHSHNVVQRDLKQHHSHSHSHKHEEKLKPQKRYNPIGGIEKKPTLEERLRNIIRPTDPTKQDLSMQSLKLRTGPGGKLYFSSYDTDPFHLEYGKRRPRNRPIQYPEGDNSSNNQPQRKKSGASANSDTPNAKSPKDTESTSITLPQIHIDNTEEEEYDEQPVIPQIVKHNEEEEEGHEEEEAVDKAKDEEEDEEEDDEEEEEEEEVVEEEEAAEQ